MHSKNIKIGIATTDDRGPTQAMIEAFDIEEFISTMVCADDGIEAKPAPDMVLTICERMKIDPAQVMVIGDTTADLKMARAAGAGLVVGVLSGVSSAKDLIPYADVLIDSVDELHTYAQVFTANDSSTDSKWFQPRFCILKIIQQSKSLLFESKRLFDLTLFQAVRLTDKVYKFIHGIISIQIVIDALCFMIDIPKRAFVCYIYSSKPQHIRPQQLPVGNMDWSHENLQPIDSIDSLEKFQSLGACQESSQRMYTVAIFP
ncbi:MAG: HAD family hydrolase [Anaerolineales bacterium]